MTVQQIRESLATVFQPSLLVRLITIIWDALTGSSMCQHVILTGFAGLGKTRLARKVGELLSLGGWRTHEIPVGISLGQFKTFLIQECTSFDRKNFLFIDECHALDGKVRQFIKPLLELGAEFQTITILDAKGVEYRLELSHHNFMVFFATNQSLNDSAIKGSSGRVTEMKMLPYELESRVSIFQTFWTSINPGLELPTKEAVLTYCRNVRPFARAIKRQILDCRAQYIANDVNICNVEGARKALKLSGYHREGWTSQHVKVLDFLSKMASGRQVQEVAAAPMQGATSKEAQEVLDELRQADFVLNTNQGRKGATSAGVAYLQSLTAKKPVSVVAKGE